MTKTCINLKKNGADMVLKKAMDLASSAGLELTRISLDSGRLVAGVKVHVLTLAAGERMARVEISGAALEELAAGAGAESTIAKLRCGIHELL